MQAQTGRAASIPSQTRSCVVPDSRISTHLQIPPQSPWDSSWEALWPPPTHRVKLHEGVSDVHRGRIPLWCFLPLTYFSLHHESIFEIFAFGNFTRKEEREGEWDGPSNLEGKIRASFRLTISVGRLHSDLFGRTRRARLDELPGEFQIVVTFATWIGSLTKIRLAAGPPSPFLSRAFPLPSFSLPRETTPVFDIPGNNIINF